MTSWYEPKERPGDKERFWVDLALIAGTAIGVILVFFILGALQ